MEGGREILEVSNLWVSVDGKEILKGLDLKVREGEIIALMGPNGSGKSTLALTIMGYPKYRVEKGDILFGGQSILNLKTYERARLGIFLSFQYPEEIPGVPLGRFLWQVAGGGKNFPQFMKIVKEKLEELKMSDDFLKRELNVGLSGGEKKRSETLQILMMNTSLLILDEIDSGLDVDAIKIVADALMKKPNQSIIIITHYTRILKYIVPQRVVVVAEGRKVIEDEAEKLIKEIDEHGYERIIRK